MSSETMWRVHTHLPWTNCALGELRSEITPWLRIIPPPATHTLNTGRLVPRAVRKAVGQTGAGRQKGRGAPSARWRSGRAATRTPATAPPSASGRCESRWHPPPAPRHPPPPPPGPRWPPGLPRHPARQRGHLRPRAGPGCGASSESLSVPLSGRADRLQIPRRSRIVIRRRCSCRAPSDSCRQVLASQSAPPSHFLAPRLRALSHLHRLLPPLSLCVRPWEPPGSSPCTMTAPPVRASLPVVRISKAALGHVAARSYCIQSNIGSMCQAVAHP